MLRCAVRCALPLAERRRCVLALRRLLALRLPQQQPQLRQSLLHPGNPGQLVLQALLLLLQQNQNRNVTRVLYHVWTRTGSRTGPPGRLTCMDRRAEASSGSNFQPPSPSNCSRWEWYFLWDRGRSAKVSQGRPLGLTNTATCVSDQREGRWVMDSSAIPASFAAWKIFPSTSMLTALVHSSRRAYRGLRGRRPIS